MMDIPRANAYIDSDESSLLPIPLGRSSTDKSRKTGRSFSDRRINAVKRVPSSSRDLARLLGYEEREAREMLYNANEQLRVQKQRADDAEQRLQDLTTRLKVVNDARLIALQESARANEELRLYKVQLETAQKEIFRAQDVLHVVDVQRYQAEKEAARERTAARTLNEEKMIQLAREEGRKIGILEGLERCRDLDFYEGPAASYAPARFRAENPVEEQEEEYLEGEEADSRTPSPHSLNDSDSHFNAPSVEYMPPSPPQVRNPPDSVAEIAQRIPSVGQIHPTIIHRITPSPRHPYVNIPPEGYIPATGLDSIIRLPPPHELSCPPPTPQRSPSPPLPPIPEGEGEPLMIPASSPTPTLPRPINPTPVRPHGVGRQSSPESNSTTISQFDMVKDPPRFNGRRSPMSVIPEVRSVHTSPNPLANKNRSLRPQPSLSGTISLPHTTMTLPTPQTKNTNIIGLEQHAHRHSVYSRPRTSSNSPDSSSARILSAWILGREDHRTSSPSIGSVNVNIQPPSRPPSTTSRESTMLQPMGNFLSSIDAHQPMPLPDRSREMRTNTPFSPETSTTIADTIILSDGQLPAGFIATGFNPAISANPLLPGFDHSPMPGGYNDVHLQTLGTQRSNDVVIPDLRLYENDLDSISDDAISSGMSTSDSSQLTTPPSRPRDLDVVI